jgi:hypothetical protein
MPTSEKPMRTTDIVVDGDGLRVIYSILCQVKESPAKIAGKIEDISIPATTALYLLALQIRTMQKCG